MFALYIFYTFFLSVKLFKIQFFFSHYFNVLKLGDCYTPSQGGQLLLEDHWWQLQHTWEAPFFLATTVLVSYRLPT